MSLLDLPPEIIIHICSSLDFVYVYQLKITNKYLNSLLDDDIVLWRNYTLDRYSSTHQPIYFGSIRNLKLFQVPSIPSPITFHRLQSLDIHYSPLMRGLDSFSSSIQDKCFPCLKEFSLRIESHELFNCNITLLITNILELKTLERLKIQFADGEYVSELSEKVANALQSCKSQLKFLDLDSLSLHILASLDCTQLKELSIKSLRINQYHLPAFKSFIEKASSLEVFRVGYVGTLAKASNFINTIIESGPPSLRILNIKSFPRNSFFQAIVYDALAIRIEHFPHLNELMIDIPTMRYNNPDGCTGLGEKLSLFCPGMQKLRIPGFPQKGDLKDLSLSCMKKFHVDGVVCEKEWKKACKHNPMVEHLIISFGRPPKKAWKYIGKYWKLKSLDLHSSEVDIQDMEPFFSYGSSAIQTLDLQSQSMGVSEQKLNDIAMKCPSLVKLKLDLRSGKKIDTNTFLNLIRRCKMLKELHLKLNSPLHKIVLANLKTNQIELIT